MGTRDHTERSLEALGAPITIAAPAGCRSAALPAPGFDARIPGDVVLGRVHGGGRRGGPGSRAVIRGRRAELDAHRWVGHLERMGADDRGPGRARGARRAGRPSVASARATACRALHLSAEETAEAIDEIPVLAAVAAHAEGESPVRGRGGAPLQGVGPAGRHGRGLARPGRARPRSEGDDLVVPGGGLRGGAALGPRGPPAGDGVRRSPRWPPEAPCVIDGVEWAGISYPGFAGRPPGPGRRGRGGRVSRRPIVAIDGPAGSGKSTLGRGLAAALGAALRQHRARCIGPSPPVRWRAAPTSTTPTRWPRSPASSTFDLDQTVRPPELRIDGRPPGRGPRPPEVEAAVSRVSRHPSGPHGPRPSSAGWAEGGAVMEGRDIGTVVFPDADVKLFLDVNQDVRASRRHGRAGRAAPETWPKRSRRRDELDARTNPLEAGRTTPWSWTTRGGRPRRCWPRRSPWSAPGWRPEP